MLVLFWLSASVQSPLLCKEGLGEVDHGRFFIEGDGTLTLANKKTGQQARIQYRLPDGTYAPQGIKRVNQVFGVPAASGNLPSTESISLRFVSLLDYLQDHFQGPIISLVSGYRSPTYNEGLRKRGKLAAKTSLHIEGMAADIEMAGVSAEKLWHFVRDLNCCGAGYYHGKALHVDTGPARFWDETSTKVETDISSHNKLIMVQTDKDIYRPGETVLMSFSRITDYPIGIRKDGKCQILSTRSQAKNIPWPLPDPSSKKQQIEINFCQKPFPEMPDTIKSNEFVIQD